MHAFQMTPLDVSIPLNTNVLPVLVVVGLAFTYFVVNFVLPEYMNLWVARFRYRMLLKVATRNYVRTH